MRTGLFSNLALVASLAGITIGGPIRPEDVTAKSRRAISAEYNVKSTNYVPLRRATTSAEVESARRLRRSVQSSSVSTDPRMSDLANAHDVYYMIDLTVGNQTLPVNLDTGSSDTWLVSDPLLCVDMAGFFMPKAFCGFREGFRGKLGGGYIPSHSFWRQYGDGTFVGGTFGFEDVTVGGLTAMHQQIAIVNVSYWFGDGLTAGLLGMAYPLMTGLNGDEDATHQYDPVFTSLWKQEETAPLFSIALSRDQDENASVKNGGNISLGGKEKGEKKEEADAKEEDAKAVGSYLAFGGVPPVDYDETTWASTPIQPLQTLKSWNFITAKENGLYVITPDAWVYGKAGAKNADGKPDLTVEKNTYPVLIDVGATLSMLPRAMVERIYANYDPPAEYLPERGMFYAQCNATAATFGIQIGGQIFYMNPADLLRQAVRDSTGTRCRVGIYDDDTGPHVLGITFLANVVSVFDIGKGEMRFAARKDY